MAYQIVLDAGHGGYDNGAVYNDRFEKDDNLNLALAVGELLAYNGMDVILTRIDDTYISPLERSYMANLEEADLFVSIHRNSSPERNVYSGVQTLINDADGFKEIIAQNINHGLESVGFTNLGVDLSTDLAVLRRTHMPSLVIEVGFINTEADNSLYDERFDEIAEAIAFAILDGIRNTEEEERPVYRVQVGLFRILENAQNLQKVLMQMGYDVVLLPQGELFAVQVGEFNNMEEAAELEQELVEQGYSTMIVQIEI